MTYRNIILFLSIICLCSIGCTKTIYKTKIEYVHPDIPEAIMSPCDPIVDADIKTNGDLLMQYISLKSLYTICASKVTSIADILQSYYTIYKNDKPVENE